jgi:hypothetical protein
VVKSGGDHDGRGRTLAIRVTRTGVSGAVGNCGTGVWVDLRSATIRGGRSVAKGGNFARRRQANGWETKTWQVGDAKIVERLTLASNS